MTLSADPNYKSKAKIVNKSQICYEPYMYTYKKREYIEGNNLKDANYIEKNVFKYENGELFKLFYKIDSFQTLTKTEYKSLISILVSLKKRNPVVRQEYMNKDRDEEILESRKKGLSRDMALRGIDK